MQKVGPCLGPSPSRVQAHNWSPSQSPTKTQKIEVVARLENIKRRHASFEFSGSRIEREASWAKPMTHVHDPRAHTQSWYTAQERSSYNHGPSSLFIDERNSVESAKREADWDFPSNVILLLQLICQLPFLPYQRMVNVKGFMKGGLIRSNKYTTTENLLPAKDSTHPSFDMKLRIKEYMKSRIKWKENVAIKNRRKIQHL